MSQTQPTSENLILEIITIGREILDGRVIDTNSSKIAELLKKQGIVPRYAQRVDDDIPRILEAFKIAESRSSHILVTGGLGPTSDDLSAEAFALFLNEERTYFPEALSHIEKMISLRGRIMNEAQKKQAYLPKSVSLLDNPHGTAPGFSLQKNRTFWAFMPGVPKEMLPMLENLVLPKIPSQKNYRSYAWATQFTSEGDLQVILKDLIQSAPKELEISFQTRFPENHIGLHGNLESPELSKKFDELKNKIHSLLEKSVFSQGTALKRLEEVVVELASQKNKRFCSVESCTGGLIAHKITQISGSSLPFWGSWITYDNQAKLLLGVKKETLEQFGAVSQQVAEEMAQLALERSGCDFAIATTGIAGPGGGSPEKPVGLCFVALASKDPKATASERIQSPISFDRDYNKTYFAQKALETLRQALLKS